MFSFVTDDSIKIICEADNVSTFQLKHLLKAHAVSYQINKNIINHLLPVIF